MTEGGKGQTKTDRVGLVEKDRDDKTEIRTQGETEGKTHTEKTQKKRHTERQREKKK